MNESRKKLKSRNKVLISGICFQKSGQGFPKNYCNPSNIFCGSWIGVTQGRQLTSLSNLIFTFFCIVSQGSSKLSSKLTNAGWWRLHPLVGLKISFLCFGQFFGILKSQTMYAYLTLFYFIIRRTSPHAHTGCTSTQAKLWISGQGWRKCASGLQPHRRRYIYNILFFHFVRRLKWLMFQVCVLDESESLAIYTIP